ncbi:odorant receptor 43a-like [Schistocerca serialis cubense]|uniref:odorant receptor 43a-like n=1 Tax=Schistocerca serialis cubense TaxID=2023355 RepID=UPI00214F280E|nr:odorant receptor 43a-like [Schistocerca serialis cubense]
MQPEAADVEWLLGPGATLRRLAGLWRQQHDNSGRLRAALTLTAVALMPAFVALKLTMDPPDELEELAMCGFVAFITSGMLVKAALFVHGVSALRQLVQLLHWTMGRYGSGGSGDATRRRYRKLSDRVYFYLQAAVVPAIIGWVCSPLLSRSVLRGAEGSGDTRRQLPAPAWLPLDVQVSPTYQLLLVAVLQSSMTVSIFVLLFVNMANLCSSMFVTAVSEKLVNCAFNCGWADCDIRFKRNLLIFMMRAMQPMEITVGKTCKLSKQMLLQVLNGTYALLNMLYNFHGSG